MAANSFIAPSTPLDRRQLGKYEVLCRLSTGGMSAIYLAHQTGLAGFKKLVVLKTILPDIGGEEDFVGMFLEEARITAAFNHPNIAQVFELDTDEGQLFMAMEFVQGCTLVEMARACRQAKEPIPLGFTLATTRDTALALHYAHNYTDARGRRQIVIHRDVAEKNIMVTYEGVTKLLDFGIAKALGRSGRTSIGMVKGTSGYMSPEQIRGEPLDPRSDVFALGVVMHECLTGLRLFHGKTAEEGMMAALREEVQPPSKWNKAVTPDVDAVVMRALERDRERRFGTALEFARAIEKAAPGALWHPEQCGELVTRHFAERRAETRRLLESVEFGSEVTGEIKVQNVLAQVRASMTNLPASNGQDRKSVLSPPPRPNPVAPTFEGTKAGVTPADLAKGDPARSEPPRPGESGSGTGKAEPVQTEPSKAGSPTGDPVTNPARPRALRTPPPSAPSPAVKAALEAGDEDASEERTIPATALPDEIKNIRAQFAAARKTAAQATAAEASQGEPHSTTARAEVLTERAGDISTDPQGTPPRSITGETNSITGNQPQMAWDDDDEGAKTAIAAPNEIPGLAAARAARKKTTQSSPKVDSPAQTSEDELDTNVPPPKRGGLVVLLVVLALLAALGLLVLLDVIPLPHLQ